MQGIDAEDDLLERAARDAADDFGLFVGQERRWVVNSCDEKTFTIPAPPPPFHLEVSIEGTFVPHDLDPSLSERRHLGAMVGITWVPGAPNKD